MRRRRTAEQAQTEILDAAERLVRSEGPAALKLTRVADEVGMSHAGVLHHIGSAERLMLLLQRRASAQVRGDLLVALASSRGEARDEAIDLALARLSDPANGRLLAWLVSTGGDPFPAVEEQGLGQIAQALEGEAEQAVLLAVLAMIGEAVLGGPVRARLGVGATDEDRAESRRWLLSALRKRVNQRT